MRTTPLRVIEAQPKLSDFDLFWESYPKKKSKGDAVKAWRQTENIRPSIEALLAAIETQLRSVDWSKDGGQYIPYPATWLRSWGWEDE